MSSDAWMSWLSADAISFENQALTKALQMSLFNGNDSSSPSSPSSASIVEEPLAAASAPAGRTRAKTGPGPQAGKIAKRKSRAKKRAPTTYIEADPENFRAMVQQTTGAGFRCVGPVIKPEPKRQSFVPRTLDKSDFLLSRAEDNAGSVGDGPVFELDEEEPLGFDVDAFLSIPTLDSSNF